MRKIAFVFIILFFGIIARSSEMDTIEKSHNRKIESAKKRHQIEVDKINVATIKKYEILKKKLARADKLEEAVEVLNRIKILKGEKGKTDDDDNEDIYDDDNDGVPDAPPGMGAESDRPAK